jgi:hypothetical protein
MLARTWTLTLSCTFDVILFNVQNECVLNAIAVDHSTPYSLYEFMSWRKTAVDKVDVHIAAEVEAKFVILLLTVKQKPIQNGRGF